MIAPETLVPPAEPVLPIPPAHVVVRGVCGTCVPPCGRPGVLYPSGWACDRSSPAARAGRPEPPAVPPPVAAREETPDA